MSTDRCGHCGVKRGHGCPKELGEICYLGAPSQPDPDPAPALLPAESLALTVGLAQTLRGDTPDPNVAVMCVLALARITGKHDWTNKPVT